MPSSSGNIKSGILHTSLSDHLPYFTSFEIPTKVDKVNPKYIKINRYDEKSLEMFNNELVDSINNKNFDTEKIGEKRR